MESLHARLAPRRSDIELLEGRSLLSGFAYGHAALTTAPAAEIQAARHVEPAVVSGTARKHPAFYESYTGPKNRDLDVVSASARLVPGRSLTLTGVMQGKIDKKPTEDARETYFVFGIDRHSTSAVTPFFQRPGITFDAVVVISVETEGISATATDLVSHQTTTLAPSSVHISGKEVSIKVDPSIFPTPAGGTDLAHSSFNLWPRSDLSNAPQPDHGSLVASFVPEDAVAPIGVVGRRGDA